MESLDRTDHIPVAEEGALARRLRALGEVSAPPALRTSVLARVGLSDPFVVVPTPIGPVFVAYTRRGIAALAPADPSAAAPAAPGQVAAAPGVGAQPSPDRSPAASDAAGHRLPSIDAGEFERRYRARFGRALHRVSEPPAWLARAIARWIEGARRPTSRIDLGGLSDFERAVLLKALDIPPGQVRPYAWIAREIGHPEAVRAVGAALGRNPIPLLIPCHRVVRSDGRIGDYAFGSPVKRRILQLEGVDPIELEQLARAGLRYVGSDTTRTYCFPTCAHARRVTGRHRVAFRDGAQARAAGYRPCKACRPAA